MPGRHRRPTKPSNTNRRIGAVGVAGVAGFAAAVAAAGGAHAAPAPSGSSTASTATPDPSTHPAPGRTTPIGEAKAGAAAPGARVGQPAAKPTKTAPAAKLQPDFGTGKIRVGVKIKNGDFVPPSTTTVGSEITIVETGDGVDGGTKTTTCNTDASTVEPGSTASYCIWDNQLSETDDYYLAQPGDSVSITQTTVNKYLAIDTSVKTFGPCAATDGEFRFCDPVTALFVDPGLPPVAVDDSAKTKANVSVIIDVLKNDDPGEPGAPVTITNITDPHHGKVLGVAGTDARPGSGRAAAPVTQTVEYDPDHNFTGVDHFNYTISTPNGKSTALVTVTVTAPPPIARDNHVRTEQNTPVTVDVENNDSARYPNTDLTIASVGTPGHGTATIDGDQIIYTPDDGFSGTDTFPYTISTPFGTDTAIVTVVIPAEVPIAVTGPDVEQGLGIALSLLVAGGGLTLAGRRRRASERHA